MAVIRIVLSKLLLVTKIYFSEYRLKSIAYYYIIIIYLFYLKCIDSSKPDQFNVFFTKLINAVRVEKAEPMKTYDLRVAVTKNIGNKNLNCQKLKWVFLRLKLIFCYRY